MCFRDVSAGKVNPIKKTIPRLTPMIIPVVIAMASLNLFAVNTEYKVEIKDITPFWFIYMEFQGEYGFLAGKEETFRQECRKQNLHNRISGQSFSILFDRKKQAWGVGSQIEKETMVQPPLKLSRYNYHRTVRRIQKGDSEKDFQVSYNLILLYLEEKGFQIVGPPTHLHRRETDPGIPAESWVEINVPIDEKKNSILLLENLYSIALILVVFVCCFFALFLFTHKKGEPLANKLFALFLTANALYYFDWLISRYIYFILPWPHVYLVGGSFIFLAAPALYLYTKALTQRHFHLKIKHLAHLLPFISDLIHRALGFHLKSTGVKRELLLGQRIFPQSEILIRLTAVDIQILGYIAAAFFILRKYKKEIKKVYSSTEQMGLQWLKIVLWIYLIVRLMNILNRWLWIHTPVFQYLLHYLTIIGFLFFVMLGVYKGLRHPEIFSGIRGTMTRKSNKELLPQGEKDRYLSKLLDYMKSRKPYLEPSLTLHELARNLAISPYYLSYVINECLQQNFYDFINSYRVKECQEILTSSSGRRKTILEVLYECGFNSKSTFNAAFKKSTGVTPKMFRKLKIE